MCVCIYGKLDMGYVLFQVIQLFPFTSPARPLAHINTFLYCFSFPFETLKYMDYSVDGYLQLFLLSFIEKPFKI